VITISCLFISCASEKPKGKTEAEILYKEANVLMKDERYILATEKLNQLKNKYPYSFYATPAELLQADILYMQENFTDAAAAYLLFKDFHPKHKKIPYVVYKIAESYYKQIPDTFDRDLQGAMEAIKYYRELMDNYSTSEFIKDASTKISICEKMLLDKEKYIADFYYKTEVYEAARWRYLDILENFKDKGIRKHSMLRVVQSSRFMKDYEKCIGYADKYFQFLGKEAKKTSQEFKNICAKEVK
jgi:outer membrane protein assembly factor BamD